MINISAVSVTMINIFSKEKIIYVGNALTRLWERKFMLCAYFITAIMILWTSGYFELYFKPSPYFILKVANALTLLTQLQIIFI